ncbi:hypothetical protein VOLCADRAFT_91709 [Volvox carteri f. nagariensis]|uniref:Uncharacterized protein n=1 Tax=Volvox carteri f. nagariensis TaxID=3068 RepID=D8TXS8_VOLCA|nr:uncharacterized protein VOLCADRAFT_91709 [Volvox carteri f. nagariensis]EFJ47777.1 hypothetical protein VOLCADRAFT_91709 [Volvox carteri f. nagariensis]|eukprot:XP_002951248.1 hypothetical protein VOLCADRAFT_91709 [Volvox carteri f. nagariensis]
MTGKRTKATGDNLVNAGAAEAAGEGGSGQMLPANQNDIEAARDTLSGNIDQPTLHQLLLGVLSAAQANAPKAPARDPRTAPPRDRSPDVVITKDVTIMPSAREQLAAIRTEVQANDAPKLTAPHEQREQLDEGTLMLLETAITALDANEPQLADVGPLLRRVKATQQGHQLQQRTGSVQSPIPSLSYTSFREKLAAMCSAVGIKRGIMPHSMRIGGNSAAAARGVSEEARKAHGRWKT